MSYNSWFEIRSPQALLDELRKVAKSTPPLTKEEIFEQKVSWAYSCRSDENMTKDQVREIIRKNEGV